MNLINIIVSIILGLLPEILYFTLFIIKLKSIKEKRILLFVLMAINYFIFILFNNYILVNYLLFTILFYIILKIIYKKKINIVDLFFIIYSEIYLTIISATCFLFVKEDLSNYYLMSIVSRILLFSIFMFIKYIKKFYLKYCEFWNRKDNTKRPIKSITLRNVSLVILNIFIFFVNIEIVNIINFLQRR